MYNVRKYGTDLFNVAVIHGGPGAGGEMAPVARELCKSFGVIEPIQESYTINGQIEELKSILKDNCSFPLKLVGYSWGAWLSFIFTAKNPDIVKKLILISSGPFEEKYASGINQTRLNRLENAERFEIESIIQLLNDPSVNDKDHLFARLGDIFSKADI